MIELPVEQFGLFAVRKSSVIAEESGLGQQAWPKPPSLRTVRMFGDDLVATGALPSSYRDFSWDRERNVDDDARDILVGISENAVAMGQYASPTGQSVRVGRWLSRSVVTGVASRSGRGIAGGVRDAASVVVLVILLRLIVLWLVSGTAPFAGRCVSVFVPLEAILSSSSRSFSSAFCWRRNAFSEKREIRWRWIVDTERIGVKNGDHQAESR